jgi:CubicO group peptidase (beta-lactamase class C family)
VTGLQEILEQHVDAGSVPGAVALVAHGEDVEVRVHGALDVEGSAPMARDAIFRVSSVTKPIIAAATLQLVDDGRLALDDPVARWLPELASPMVVREPNSAIDDVVPAERAITVEDLLTFRGGHGFPSDFSLPAIAPLFSQLKQGPPMPQLIPAPDDWMAALGGIPLLYQPGQTWLYNTGSDILGVLIARVSGRPLPEFLADRLFEPLRMVDTAFEVPSAERDRFTSYYRPGQNGLELVDAPDGQWSRRPAFASGSGGLASTADDLLAFGRLLLAGGTLDGRQLLTRESVRLMTSDHLTRAQREASRLFLDGQGWGYGGSVDVDPVEPWNVPGRYGWVGATGTAAHIVPSSNTVTVVLTNVEMSGPVTPALMQDVWSYANSGEDGPARTG